MRLSMSACHRPAAFTIFTKRRVDKLPLAAATTLTLFGPAILALLGLRLSRKNVQPVALASLFHQPHLLEGVARDNS